MAILNIGILAHVDAGKTTLTERILYDTGAITSIGSVDKGTTQTDTLDLEHARDITIKSAAGSFQLGDLKVNLIDTPDQGDFIAEVEHVSRRVPAVARSAALHSTYSGRKAIAGSLTFPFSPSDIGAQHCLPGRRAPSWPLSPRLQVCVTHHMARSAAEPLEM